METREELLQAKLKALVTRFRAALEQVVATEGAPSHIRGFPRGCCGIVSELMGDYLNTLGIGDFHYVCSVKGGASHDVEVFIHESSTLSTLLAEQEAKQAAKKKNSNTSK